MTQTYRNYIGGKWVEAASGAVFEDRNPADRHDLLGFFPRSDARDVAAAVEAARARFDFWRKVPAPVRGEILFRAAEIMVKRKEELARLMVREMGKVIKEARGDVQEAIDMTYYMAGEGRRQFGQQVPAELPDKFAMAIRQPVGVVAAITPWNFPLAIPAWKLMPALVTGNVVVFKPAEDTPLMAVKLVEILLEAGLPEGVVNLVHGYGEEAGAPLVEHPGVDLVSFTGSTEVGRQVAMACARTGKRCALEMGGKNPIIVMDDADLDLALDGAVWSAFGTSGQRCTAASRLIVHEGIAQVFTERLAERAARLRLGPGIEETTDVGPVINEAQLHRVHGYTEIGRREGAQLVVGGEIATEGALAAGYFYKPTVFANVTPRMRIAQEEIFGPTTAVMPVRSLAEALEVANGVQYGLSAAIYTRDINKAFRAIAELRTGLVYVNAGTIGAEIQLPFGGTKATGNGHREAGTAALDTFTEWKTVYIDYSGRLQRAQIDQPRLEE
ncbi:MAG TPA: aldehyde dehydrogenase family protein [Thermodesulfobacteriota bacterium]|nr:aldehyde dehydrogenase family protein [Thermodesulfobacteriota bacterium]